MKNLITKLLVLVLAVSTVSQAAATMVLTPKRWWECTWDSAAKDFNKKKCSDKEKKAALMGSVVGGLAAAGLITGGAVAAYGGYKASQGNIANAPTTEYLGSQSGSSDSDAREARWRALANAINAMPGDVTLTPDQQFTIRGAGAVYAKQQLMKYGVPEARAQEAVGR
jgi:hypothetical protein